MAGRQCSAGQGKFAGQDRRSNHYAMPPTWSKWWMKTRGQPLLITFHLKLGIKMVCVHMCVYRWVLQHFLIICPLINCSKCLLLFCWRESWFSAADTWGIQDNVLLLFFSFIMLIFLVYFMVEITIIEIGVMFVFCIIPPLNIIVLSSSRWIVIK